MSLGVGTKVNRNNTVSEMYSWYYTKSHTPNHEACMKSRQKESWRKQKSQVSLSKKSCSIFSWVLTFPLVLALHSWVQSWKPKENTELSISYFGQSTFLLRPHELAGAAWLIPRQAISFQISSWNFTALFPETTPSGNDLILHRIRCITSDISTISLWPLPCKKVIINNP